MKKTLPALALTFSCLWAVAQVNNFKPIIKDSSVPIQNIGGVIQINGSSPLKSAISSRYRSMIFPAPNVQKKSKQAEVIFRETGPVFIEKKTSPLKSASDEGPQERFYSFMEASADLTGIAQPRKLFTIHGVETDRLGITHVKVSQKWKDIEIYGSESVFHFDEEKERFTGRISVMKNAPATDPVLYESDALQVCLNDLQRLTVCRELSPKEMEFLHYKSPSCSLVIFDKGNNNYVLAWTITIRPNFLEQWRYFIDAVSGEILRKFNNTNSDGPVSGSGYDLNNVSRSFDAYLEQGTYYLAKVNDAGNDFSVLTLDAANTSTVNLDYRFVTSPTSTFSQKAAISAHYNAIATLNYLNATFGRVSIDSSGGTIFSLVNVAEDDGSSMENAFWNGYAVFYGNGGSIFKPLAGGLDVSAHELGHGVVSKTANLEYYGQSGAINETYADIFGSMVDRNDWLIGEDVIRNTSMFPSGALRNMASPHNGGTPADDFWQPEHLSEIYLGQEDNAGVHINSGIGNRAYYLFATATSREKAEQVFYRALNHYLTKTSQFVDLRIAVIQSARDIFGSSSQEVIKAAEVFNTVGIREEIPVETNPDYQANPGQPYLLTYDVDISDPATLYRSGVSGDNFIEISRTAMKRKVSVTDDGVAGVFVTLDGRIKVFSPNPAEPFEDYLSIPVNKRFDNIAVSKDGRRLAAISTEIDTSIYLYDFTRDQWYKFLLYNPTTSHYGGTAGGVLYADAIEFDITGEYLMYDACNVLSSSTNNDIYYFDIGFIKVWDNATNQVGNGSIFKLFNTLPENVSIGNPVFARNSTNIIAFDYLYDDGIYHEYGIYGANLETGELGFIFENDTLGFPTFSIDDNTLAFTTLYGNDRHEIVATIPLSEDKITPSGNAAGLVNYATWPVYYATGERILTRAPVANFTSDLCTGKAPVRVKFIDLSANSPTSWQWTFPGGSPSSSAQQHPEVTYAIPGTYLVTLKASNQTGSNTMTKDAYIVVTAATRVESQTDPGFNVFPNPVRDLLTIPCESSFSYGIYDMQGHLMMDGQNRTLIDVSTFAPGIYFLKIEKQDGIVILKLIKE